MTPAPHHVDDGGGELFAALAAQERRVLNLLLGHRRIAEPISRAAGLEMCHFDQDDHRLIFAGWLVACEDDLPLVPMLRLIRRALQADGLWDPAAPRGSTGMRHSDATLAELATAAVTDEEIEDVVRGTTDGLRRGIARHVCALVDAANTVEGVRP